MGKEKSQSCVCITASTASKSECGRHKENTQILNLTCFLCSINASWLKYFINLPHSKETTDHISKIIPLISEQINHARKFLNSMAFLEFNKKCKRAFQIDQHKFKNHSTAPQPVQYCHRMPEFNEMFKHLNWNI